MNWKEVYENSVKNLKQEKRTALSPKSRKDTNSRKGLFPVYVPFCGIDAQTAKDARDFISSWTARDNSLKF